MWGEQYVFLVHSVQHLELGTRCSVVYCLDARDKRLLCKGTRCVACIACLLACFVRNTTSVDTMP